MAAAGTSPANATATEAAKTPVVTTARTVNSRLWPGGASTSRRWTAYSHVAVSRALARVMLAA